MGNGSTSFIEQRFGNPFFSPNSKDESEASQLLSQFSLISTYEDELFKRCSVIEHKQTQELIIVKEANCENEREMEQMYSEFERRRETLTDENLLRLRYVLKKKSDGIFSDEFKVVLFFDYVLTSLHEELKTRKLKQLEFTADQVNMIICGAVKGYAALEQQKIPNNKVRVRNIYFGLKDKEPFIKVIDSKLFPNKNNQQCVAARDTDCEDVFLAPQQLKEYTRSPFDHFSKESTHSKSGIFSLGMSMMEICLLTASKQLYQYQSKNINYQQIQIRLNIIKNKYPLSVFYLIREMLERNEESRPSFTKLHENLPTNIKNLSNNSRVNLSIINSASTKHVNPQKRLSKILPPTGYTKVINPTVLDTKDRKMQTTTLTSQYRPNVDSSEVYTNGNMYTGQKKDSLRHGKGKYIYNDGSYYYGDWFKGKMEGQGQLYHANGDLEYEGQWKDDHYHGSGILKGNAVDWQKYEGNFVNGKMEGFGEMLFNDGNRYKGEFRNDYPWGKGRMFLKNGGVQAGIWERGNFIQQL